MAYLAHTAHLQFLGLLLGILGWILIMCSAGINEWRLWYVSDKSVITSGVAWVGVWRACFYSHIMSTAEYCQALAITDSFLPADIVLAQVLIMMAVVTGIIGNLTAGYGMRKVYFGLGRRRAINLTFWSAGAMYLFTATCSLVPLLMNTVAVLNNDTITFPPEYYFPPAPTSQGIGSGIGLGIGASFLVAFSGLLFLVYRYPKKDQQPNAEVSTEGNGYLVDSKPWSSVGLRSITEGREEISANEGKDNPAFELEEN
ncbi:claudin-34 [Alosa sapidissima]|uniref:claudin-34 n=1 Tax=Alosa sapidissima TaxID=34773 RepID=UPI001C08BFF1|nr:claudin-34 [Alosa sapidissima]